MGQTVSFQEVLRRLAIIDESFAEDQAGLRLDLPGSRLLDPKTAALVQVGALVAIGAPGACLEWGTTRALAADTTGDEITGVPMRQERTPRSSGWPASGGELAEAGQSLGVAEPVAAVAEQGQGLLVAGGRGRVVPRSVTARRGGSLA